MGSESIKNDTDDGGAKIMIGFWKGIGICKTKGEREREGKGEYFPLPSADFIGLENWETSSYW